MKKLLKSLVLFALVFSSVKASTNKTTLLPRSHGVNLAMEYTTWNELLQMKDDDRFGAHFQATVFYQDSTDDDDLGKYFGVRGKNYFQIASTGVALANRDVESRHILHDNVPAGAPFFAHVKLEPEQTAWGVRIDYYQDLEKLLKGLYLKVALPIVNVDNDVNFRVITGTDGAPATAANLRTFFNGTLAEAGIATGDGQLRLTHAKFTGSHSETSVADIDVVLGYKFLDKEKYHMSINLGLTIPVGTDPDGVYVFEPVVGNGDHWAFGAGLDFGAKLWEDGDQNIKFTTALNYRYLFEGTENRTLGIKNGSEVAIGNTAAGATLPWGQYYLLGDRAIAWNTQMFMPAANVLTRGVDVEPGSQLDWILAFAYNNGGFSIDLGYNLFWKEHEDVDLKGWDENKWCVANVGQDGNAGVAPANPGANGNLFNLTRANIDVAVAETPSYLTHKIYGGLGYIFKEWKYPLMLGMGAHYEFAGDNDQEVENWGLWGKIGVAF